MTDQVDDFEKHFAEFSGQHEASESAVESKETAPEAVADTSKPNTLADEQPAPEAKKEESLAEPDKLTKLQNDYEALQRKFERATGSISGYERHLQAERAERAKLEQALAQAMSKPQTQAQQDAKDDSIAYLQENFPELSNALERVIETKLKGLDQRFAQVDTHIKEAVAPIQQRFVEDQTAREFDTLGRAHPDWRSVVNTPEYANWLDGQPAVVQSLMDSPIASDAVWLLNQYKASKGTAQQQPASTATEELASRRQKELSQAVGVQTRGSAPPTPAEDGNGSYESSFDFFARRREAQAANRR